MGDPLRACLEVVLWKRKWQILGSDEAHFRAHSGAMGEKIAEIRFQKRTFAAQMTTSKHALNDNGNNGKEKGIFNGHIK